MEKIPSKGIKSKPKELDTPPSREFYMSVDFPKYVSVCPHSQPGHRAHPTGHPVVHKDSPQKSGPYKAKELVLRLWTHFTEGQPGPRAGGHFSVSPPCFRDGARIGRRDVVSVEDPWRGVGSSRHEASPSGAPCPLCQVPRTRACPSRNSAPQLP